MTKPKDKIADIAWGAIFREIGSDFASGLLDRIDSVTMIRVKLRARPKEKPKA